jgi:hypothetical protein
MGQSDVVAFSEQVMRLVVVLFSALLLGTCTTNPVSNGYSGRPDGYNGPIAYVRDSMTPRSRTSADLFYIADINGRAIDNSMAATERVNYGRGMRLEPVVMGRNVPAERSTFKIVGRTHHAAPILALLNKVYEVSGETTFAPESAHAYTVKGVLGDNYSAVWVEDIATGAQIGDKIEIKGSSTLGIFQK